MIDHMVIHVRDLEASRRFYGVALSTLGYEIVKSFPEGTGFGPGGKPVFWIATREGPHTGVHIAFASPDRGTVDAFYEAAIAAGGRDNGKPGLREHYHADYYGAFVLDPDGNNIEAVCHLPSD
jgi:catechol 2,3-dioxygenase-like lactoylglutathione lyase family enzyme